MSAYILARQQILKRSSLSLNNGRKRKEKKEYIYGRLLCFLIAIFRNKIKISIYLFTKHITNIIDRSIVIYVTIYLMNIMFKLCRNINTARN